MISAICPSERESDVLVEGCPGGLLVLLERVWRWLKVSTGDQGIYKGEKAEPVAMRTSVVPVSTIPAVELKIDSPSDPYVML